MKVQTRKIDLIGFDRIQEILMRMKLSEVSLPEGEICIELHQPIDYGKCDCCWYGGTMATVKWNNNEFEVVAEVSSINGNHIVCFLVHKVVKTAV